MSVYTEWKSRVFRFPPPLASYGFYVADGNLSMSAVGTPSADLDLASSDEVEWVPPERQITRMLVDLFRQIPEVKSICAQFDADQIRIWTLLESYDREAREKVYEKEMEICRALRVHDFDFRVTSEELVSPEELERTGSRIVYRRR
jgi:hypothetical protein